jgi:hypothetical protein
MDKAFWSLTAFIAVQFALMGLAMLPRQFWKGRAARDAGGGTEAAKA